MVLMQLINYFQMIEGVLKLTEKEVQILIELVGKAS